MGKKKSIIVISLAAGAFVLLAVQNILNTKKINELQNQISNQINDFEVSVKTDLTSYQQQVEAQLPLHPGAGPHPLAHVALQEAQDVPPADPRQLLRGEEPPRRGPAEHEGHRVLRR